MSVFELIYDNPTDVKLAKMKSDFIILLTAHLRDKFKTRKEMSEFLGVSASEVSKIVNGQLSSISFEKLFKHMLKLGLNVETQLTIYREFPVKCELTAK